MRGGPEGLDRVEDRQEPVVGGVGRSALLLPAAAAVLVGAGSALTWTFGPVLLSEAGAVPPDGVGGLWVALGLGGLLGPLAGVLVGRAGLRGGWVLSAAALAVASAGAGLAAAAQEQWAALATTAVFGAGYMATSAVLILWARHAWPPPRGGGDLLALRRPRHRSGRGVGGLRCRP
ncbi:hypothetical protein [Nocardioides perillae]|uniref:Putative MFS family arabinose efflux permease n=1 Tax=Nocardioides perillae TaxID=1119534 RepID=A0A7Y9RS45_9ACTN|nr:hypothetical protein [Nocardioides perillae]NYG53943.1 putative MFS family arabinose efflux permease [Nocardioides perillae]